MPRQVGNATKVVRTQRAKLPNRLREGGVQRVPVPRPVKWVDEFELALAPASRPASEAGAEACSTEDGKAPAGAS